MLTEALSFHLLGQGAIVRISDVLQLRRISFPSVKSSENGQIESSTYRAWRCHDRTYRRVDSGWQRDMCSGGPASDQASSSKTPRNSFLRQHRGIVVQGTY